MNIPAAFHQFLASRREIVLINHWNPDGDAVGSTLALGGALAQAGHGVTVVMPNAYPHFLRFLSTGVDVVIHEHESKRAKELIERAELIGTLDFNQPDRCGEALGALLRAASAKVFMLDHHREPANYADFTFSYPDVASTCELVYELLKGLDLLDTLNPSMANALYTGIMTDTGSFRFSAVRPRTHEITADLLRKGAEPWRIHQAIFDQDRPSRLRLLGRCLEHMELREEIKSVFMWLDKQDQESLGYEKGDTEGFVNYGLSVAGIELSALAIERKDGWKLSLRSKGELDVSAIVRAHFSGGGHFNAAGGQFQGTQWEIRDILWQIMEKRAHA